MQLTKKQKSAGWRIVKFEDVAQECKEKVDRGNNPFERYVTGGDMDSENLIISRWGVFGDDYVGPAFHRVFRKGQILYGSRRTYLKKVAVADFDGVTANTTFVIEPMKDSFLVPGLLPYIMLSDMFTRHSVGNSKGSTNPYILWSDIAKFEFPLPPRSRQLQIAQLQKHIENLKKSNNNCEINITQLKKILIQDILKNVDYKDVSLRNIADVIASPVNKKSVKGQSPIRLCNYMDVYSNNIINNQTKFMDATASDSEISRFALRKGDVVITKDSEDPCEIAVPSFISEHIENLVCGYHLTILRPINNLVEGRYLFHLLNSLWARHQFYPYAQGMTRYGVVSDAYDKIKIPLPSIKKQHVYADALDSLNEQFKIIRNRNEMYNSIQKKIINKRLLEAIT